VIARRFGREWLRGQNFKLNESSLAVNYTASSILSVNNLISTMTKWVCTPVIYFPISSQQFRRKLIHA
jgi:hypothetical protein